MNSTLPRVYKHKEQDSKEIRGPHAKKKSFYDFNINMRTL